MSKNLKKKSKICPKTVKKQSIMFKGIWQYIFLLFYLKEYKKIS